jgi:hypothetical protein
MSKLKVVPKNDFKLESVKFKSGKIVIEFSHSELIDDRVKQKTVTVKSKTIPHPNLTDLFSQIREYLAKELLIQETPNNLNSIEILGFKLVKEKIIINGTLETITGGVVSINSSLIDLKEDDDFEREISVIVDAVVDEVYDFVYKNKRANPDLFQQEVKSGLNVKAS